MNGPTPPTTGKGSGVQAWRAYAASATETPVSEWDSATREYIIEMFSGPSTPGPAESSRETKGDTRTTHRRPVWMVPTEDGLVPEHVYRYEK